MLEIHYAVILAAALVAIASPGPATLAIAGTSMNQGRIRGLTLASGILSGSLIWSCSAAFGLGAVMYANVWLFQMLRYVGAGYLLFLALKSLLSTRHGNRLRIVENAPVSIPRTYLKGLAIHLTNPKAILFFSALYAIGIPHNTSIAGLWSVIMAVGVQSSFVFIGYALLFSTRRAQTIYLRLGRWFDLIFGMFFGIAGIKVLVSTLDS
ncbi:LysE family translocator [Gynuella sp.]|uniref:LysE family translocator n=1 Tax=Gynuella sp. TaxID=2969146 RepID=UPI003D0D0E7B